ncbi:MAG: ketol-acid reductoisomerase [Anaerolineae bacterium]|jgi:ketol-acid reductoisomerase
MRIYHDEDADLSLLADRQIAVIGYGNQGRAQALNLRDSGLHVLIGNRDDDYARRAREDQFQVLPIETAASEADLLMLLIPDEVAPGIFAREIAPHLDTGNALIFATGYSIAFGFITPPPSVDVILVAPRMIGAGVRDLYEAGRGFPSFIGVAQDHSGKALEIALALAKGIGSTRTGVVEVTFAQEAELDLFTEQCFGPAFGHVLTTAVNLLLEEGYPPEAVLLELYMSGEFAYTLGKIAELGLVGQSVLHSRTSQYGSMSRGVRFTIPELRLKMVEGLQEIRSGQFAQEWASEEAAGAPTLEALRQAAQSLPLVQLEQELRRSLRDMPTAAQVQQLDRAFEPEERQLPTQGSQSANRRGLLGRGLDWIGRSLGKPETEANAQPAAATPSQPQMEETLRHFLSQAEHDPALQAFAQDRELTTHYVLRDSQLEFTMRFHDGEVVAHMGPPASPAEVRLETDTAVLDGMFTGRINAMRAFMSGKLSFSGEAGLAITIQQVQDDLCRLYTHARSTVR